MEEYEKLQFKLKVVRFCKLMFAMVVVFGISMYVIEQKKVAENITNTRIDKISSIQTNWQNSYK